MLIGALWAFTNALEMAGTDLITKLFWANLQYFAYAFAPVVWIILVFQFTGRAHRVNKRNIILISIIPVMTNILIWTNNLHGLMRYNIILDITGSFPVIAKNYGTWFWVHYSYSGLLNLLIFVLLFAAVRKKNTFYQKQALCLFIGHILIMICNFLYVIGMSPFKRFDVSPIIFSVSGLIIAWGIFHYRLFELVPIARATVIEKMAIGIIVVDKMNRIIDINPQAKAVLQLEQKIKIGQSLSSIPGNLDKLIMNNMKNNLSSREFGFKYQNEIFYYEVFTSNIMDYRQKIVARVLIFSDITALKKAREQANLQTKELAIMNDRNRMARELHDNLGQTMSFANVQIPAIRQELKKGNIDLAENYLLRLNEIVRAAHKEIREFVYNIRDDDNYQDNLPKLLQKQVTEFKNISEIRITLTHATGDRVENPDNKLMDLLGIEEKMQLLNITREALTNVLKHAAANSVNIMLLLEEECLKLIIRDDGRGMDRKNKKIGSGLSIMYERARLIGGQLRIESQSGMGTRLVVTLPVQTGGNKGEYTDSR